MDKFLNLFGILENEIKPTCVLTPYLTKGLLADWHIKSWNKGLRYSSGSNDRFTLILTGIGAGFVGDAVLLLANSPCQKMFFFGSAGLVRETEKLKYGSLVLAQECFSLESFSDLLCQGVSSPSIFRPNKQMMESFAKYSQVPSAIGASVGSLVLEERYEDFFSKEKINILDMECSAFFSAAQSIGKPSTALLYITDILGLNHLGQPRTPQQDKVIFSSIQSGQKLIYDFVGLKN